jgi:hypothetical protein
MRLGPAAVRFDGPVMTASRSTQHRRSLPFQSSLQAMRHVEGIVNFAVEPSSARDCLVALRHRPCTRRSGCGELTQRLASVANRRMNQRQHESRRAAMPVLSGNPRAAGIGRGRTGVAGLWAL